MLSAVICREPRAGLYEASIPDSSFMPLMSATCQALGRQDGDNEVSPHRQGDRQRRAECKAR